MAANTEKILTEALGLPQTARAYVAEKLIESLDADQPTGLSEAWREVVLRRCREIDTEAVELRETEEVFNRAYASIK